MWNGDSNSSSYYVIVNSSNTGNVESGWISSTSWKPNLPNQNYIYTWKVKARNSQGVEGPWSDESHFSTASTTLKFEGDISFNPSSPSSADKIKIFASTTGWGGVGITLRVSVNTAPDGSTNGEWKILKELGVPKFNENDAPEWNTQGWSNGTYKVRVEAKGPNDPNWQSPAIVETTYTLINKIITTSETTTYTENNEADLTVSNIKFYESYKTNEITPQAGNTVTAFAVLKNNGGQETGIFNVKWFLDGQEVGYGSHASLKPGEVSDGNIRYNWVVTTGNHTLSFVADCDNNVGETNEGNNNFQITVNVASESTSTTDGQEFQKFIGYWENIDPNTRSITKVQIREENNQIFIHIWGACLPEDCDWGENIPDSYDSGNNIIFLTWNQDFAIKNQQIDLLSDESLQVNTHVHFIDNSGRSDYDSSDVFYKTNE